MQKKSAFGWLELILGILFIALGIYTFMEPKFALSGFVIVYGIVAIICGIVDIVFYASMEKRTGFGPVAALVTGIFSVLFGVLLLFYSDIGIVAISIIFPLWFIAHCISRLSNVGFIKLAAGNGPFYLSLFLYISGIILGIILLFNLSASAVTFSYIIAVYLVILGIGSVVTSFYHLKK